MDIVGTPTAGVKIGAFLAFDHQERFMTAVPVRLSPTSEIAVAFLRAMERRDLDAARKLLAPDFTMCFPGGHVMRRLEELVERSGGRYRSVAKKFDRVDEASTDEGVVVYCSGTLYGNWSDGVAFEGIRFIDRFEVVDGLIRRQDVWNDMGEVLRR
jgi:hypothetical protein